jgi:hypothetical protein
LINQFGLKSPIDASNTLLSAKRIFKAHLSKVIEEYAGQDAATAIEIQALKDFLVRLAKRGSKKYARCQEVIRNVTGDRTVMSDFDSSATVCKSRAKKLGTLMATGEERAKLWRPDELAAIFRHQMSAQMLVDLGTFDLRTATMLRTLSEAQGLLLKSFADLFHQPAPLIKLLELVKDFDKANLDHPESSLPG